MIWMHVGRALVWKPAFKYTPQSLMIYSVIKYREHFPCFILTLKTRVEVWENEKWFRIDEPQASVLISQLPSASLVLCFYQYSAVNRWGLRTKRARRNILDPHPHPVKSSVLRWRPVLSRSYPRVQRSNENNLRVVSLKRSTAGAFAVPFRVKSRKNMTGDNVLF